MAMLVTYATVNGQLVYEDRGGVETYYLKDPLDSVVQCHNATGAKTHEAWYWPYRQARASTGSNPSPRAFVGSLGHCTDDNSHIYVRARTYRPDLARWQTVDLLLPSQLAYRYCNARPIFLTDRSGMGPARGPGSGCPPSRLNGTPCTQFLIPGTLSNADLAHFLKCIIDCDKKGSSDKECPKGCVKTLDKNLGKEALENIAKWLACVAASHLYPNLPGGKDPCSITPVTDFSCDACAYEKYLNALFKCAQKDDDIGMGICFSAAEVKFNSDEANCVNKYMGG